MLNLENYRKTLKEQSNQELFDLVREFNDKARQKAEAILELLMKEWACSATIKLYQYLRSEEVQDSIFLNEVLKELHCRVEGKTYKELFSGKK